MKLQRLETCFTHLPAGHHCLPLHPITSLPSHHCPFTLSRPFLPLSHPHVTLQPSHCPTDPSPCLSLPYRPLTLPLTLPQTTSPANLDRIRGCNKKKKRKKKKENANEKGICSTKIFFHSISRFLFIFYFFFFVCACIVSHKCLSPGW